MRREDGQRGGPVDVEIAIAKEGLDSLAVDLQSLHRVVRDVAVAEQGIELGQQRGDLARAGRRGGELGRIEIEEEADHHRLIGFDLRQGSERVLRELVGMHARRATRRRSGGFSGVRGRTGAAGEPRLVWRVPSTAWARRSRSRASTAPALASATTGGSSCATTTTTP